MACTKRSIDLDTPRFYRLFTPLSSSFSLYQSAKYYDKINEFTKIKNKQNKGKK